MKVKKIVILRNFFSERNDIIYFEYLGLDFALKRDKRGLDYVGYPIHNRVVNNARQQLDYLKSARPDEQDPEQPRLIGETEIPDEAVQNLFRAFDDAYETDQSDPSFEGKINKQIAHGREVFEKAGEF